jgi:hypothetical protein
MSSWMPARPSQMLSADLKRIGFNEKQIAKLLATSDKAKLRAEATKLIEAKREKAKEIKAACNKAIPGLNW